MKLNLIGVKPAKNVVHNQALLGTTMRACHMVPIKIIPTFFLVFSFSPFIFLSIVPFFCFLLHAD